MLETDILETQTESNNSPQEIIAPTGLRRITLENVQSVASLTLDFDESGVYRLVGDNDVGKSAILRGIKALFHNVSRNAYKEYISDWADTFVVEGWFYDGGYVKLSRGANDFYEWSLPHSSEIVYKTDGKVPEILEEYFNLYIEKDKSKMNLNFNLQGDSLPFVDTSASDNYWLTQKALGTNNLLKASKLLKSDTKDINKSIKKTLETITYEENLVQKISNEITQDRVLLTQVETNMVVIEEEYNELLYAKEILEKETYLQSLKDEFETIPSISESELLSMTVKARKVNAMSDFVYQTQRMTQFTNELEEINSKVDSFNELVTIQTKLTNLGLLQPHATKLKTKVDLETQLHGVNLKIIPIEDITHIQTKLTQLTSLKKIKELQDKINQLSTSSLALDTDILSCDNAITQLKEDEKVCPICGSDLLVVHTHSK